MQTARRATLVVYEARAGAAREVEMIRIATLVVMLAACFGASPAAGSFPGENGRIVFSSNRVVPSEIYSMNEDGTDIRRLTWNATQDQFPRVSPDGSRIVFARTVAGNDLDIWIMNADGTGEQQLTSGPARDEQPAFTQTGDAVVFQRVPGAQGVCPCEIRIVGADGSGERLVDTGPGNAANPDVSKNGKLAFVGDRDGTRSIYVTDLRGGPVKRVTVGPALEFGDYRPRWSPRGNDLVFMRNELGPLSSIDIWTVHQDGTDLRRLTATERVEDFPQWSPDGSRIVFAVVQPSAPFAARLLTMNADGTNERLLPLLAAPLVDDFDDGRVDTSLWHTIVTGTHTAIAETGGAVVVTIGAAAEPGGPFNAIDAHLGSQCSLPADYDMRIAYRLLDWPAANGVQVALNAYFAGAFVFRESKPWGEQLGGWVPPVFGATPATELGGTLRLVRADGIVTAYALRDGAWLQLARGANPGDAVFGFSASAFAEWSHQDVRVAFDDFRLDSGELACPSFWRDTTPDWAVG
jgi:dipeptidyl aminopeptidase/acylaminoacyl peptidase